MRKRETYSLKNLPAEVRDGKGYIKNNLIEI